MFRFYGPTAHTADFDIPIIAVAMMMVRAWRVRLALSFLSSDASKRERRTVEYATMSAGDRLRVGGAACLRKRPLCLLVSDFERLCTSTWMRSMRPSSSATILNCEDGQLSWRGRARDLSCALHPTRRGSLVFVLRCRRSELNDSAQTQFSFRPTSHAIRQCHSQFAKSSTDIGDVQAPELVHLEEQFGRYGQRLFELARGIDRSPVVPNRVSKSASAEDTFPNDLLLPELEPAIHRLAEKVWNASRANARQARTIVLKLKTREFTTLTRSLTPTQMPQNARELAELALSLFDRADLGPSQLFRLAGVGLSNFQIEAELPLLADEDAQANSATKSFG